MVRLIPFNRNNLIIIELKFLPKHIRKFKFSVKISDILRIFPFQCERRIVDGETVRLSQTIL